MYPAALWSPMTAADHVDVVASSLALRAVLLVALPWPPGAACIEPDVADPDVAPPDDADPLPHFRLLRAIAERNDLPGLSMGMSADFETAIAEGATHVRVGSAIFGMRPKQTPEDGDTASQA